MKVTVALGYDQSENTRTLNFARELGVLRAELSLVHVLERLSAWDEAAGVQDFIEQVEQDPFWLRRQAEGKSILAWASKKLQDWDLPCSSHLLDGFIGNEIIAFIEKNGSDLVVIGSSDKGPIEGILIGSVGRKLLIGAPCSVLIAKQDVPSDAFKVILANDQSPFASNSFEHLLSYPQIRFREVLVLTALDKTFELANDSSVRKQNKELLASFASIAERLRSCEVDGEVDDVIERKMREENADLLIMAAQGHGFFERMLIGSHSLKAAMSQKKSVLILRRKLR